MKRTIILSLLCLSGAMSNMAQEAFTDSGISYLLTSGNTVAVIGCELGEGDLAIIPESITHDSKIYNVTSVGVGAFKDSYVAAIGLPKTITEIGDSAFYGCVATYIQMPEAVTRIGNGAFAECKALGHLNLPASLQQIGDDALSSTPLYSIGDEANLQHLTHIGENALANTRLQKFPLTDAVSELGSGAFSGCSRLKEIHLPASLTKIPDHLFSECQSLTYVELPNGITHIGQSAFANSGLTGIDLSEYKGSIGVLAFNGCQHLNSLSLPANNPNCYTSSDGKLLYGRESKELITVLPNAERIVIPYPATGVYEQSLEQSEYKSYSYPLSGAFFNLTELELPHSWKASMGDAYTPALKTLTMRMPSEYFSNQGYSALNGLGEGESPCDIYVFSYAMDELYNSPSWRNYVQRERDADTREYYYKNLHAIERPTEQLYMAEVRPLYDNLSYVEDRLSILWDADWNTALENTFPQYFTSGDVWNSRYGDVKLSYRNYLMSQYMTPNHFRGFCTAEDSTIQCLDGMLCFAKGFDVNNYANWFLHTNFIPAPDFIPYGTTFGGSTDDVNAETYAADAAWQLPVENYSVLSGASETRVPNITYALRMVPDVKYNIYAVVPPHHPWDTEEQTYRNKFRGQFASISEIGEDGAYRTSNVRSEDLDVSYETGQVDTLLIFQDVQVISDIYNVLTLNSSAKIADRRNGYTDALALIGILVVPQTELETYPDAMSSTKVTSPTVQERYDLSGRRITSPSRGITILRMSDGTTRKVMVK